MVYWEGAGDRAGAWRGGACVCVCVCVGTVVWCTSSGEGREKDESSAAGVNMWTRLLLFSIFASLIRLYNINIQYLCVQFMMNAIFPVPELKSNCRPR